MLTPSQAAEDKVKKAGEYARLSERLEDIRKVKPMAWLGLRETAKSDKAADRAWEATPMGIEEMSLVMQMKRVEKEISALNSYIRVSENEARQLY